MENAEVISFDRKKFYGFARVVTFAQGEKLVIIWPKEIIFHFGRGYKMKEGKEKPKFNYKQKLKKGPRIGEYLVFVGRKSENKNPRDKVAVWGLRKQYNEIWRRIDKRNKRQKKQKKLDHLFHRSLIKTENFHETKKAL